MIETDKSAHDTALKARPVAYLIHSFIGLNFCALLAMIFLTGTVATVSNEIGWLADPAVRSSVPRQAYRWGKMWDGIRGTIPQAHISGIFAFEPTDQTYFARSAELIMPGGVFARAWVDPGTGHVNQLAYGKDFPDFMRALHYRFLSPSMWAVYLCTACGPLLLILSATGLLTYKKFWRGFLRKPRIRRGMRILWGDLHRLLGVWSLWFILVVALTGSWYLFEDAGPEIEQAPPVSSPLPLGWNWSVTGRDIDAWVTMAERALPGLSVRRVGMPYDAAGPVSIEGQWHARLVRERANAVFIDPIRHRVIRVQTVEGMSILQRLSQTADPLHFGTFGGLTTKLIWFGMGSLLVGMAVSGMAVFYTRTAMAVKRLDALKPAPRVKLPLLLYMAPTLILYTIVVPTAYFKSFSWQGYPQLRHLGFARSNGLVAALVEERIADEDPGDDRKYCVELPSQSQSRIQLATMAYGFGKTRRSSVFMTDVEGSLCAAMPREAGRTDRVWVNALIANHKVTFNWKLR